MNERIRGLDMTSQEGWVAPLVITPEFVDLAIEQLREMDEEPVVFLFYRKKLYTLIMASIAERRCDNPALCCEIALEAEVI